MKQFKRILAVVLLIVGMLAVGACGDFADYDDDAVISTHSGWGATLAVESTLGPLYTFSSQSCSGVKRIREVTVPKNPKFSMEIAVESGRFKVVLIDEAQGVVYTIASNEEEAVLSTDIPAGTYQFAIVAQNANVTLFQVYFSVFS